MSKLYEVSVIPDERGPPLAWRVECVHANGDVDVTIFSGPECTERAKQYALWKYLWSG